MITRWQRQRELCSTVGKTRRPEARRPDMASACDKIQRKAQISAPWLSRRTPDDQSRRPSLQSPLYCLLDALQHVMFSMGETHRVLTVRLRVAGVSGGGRALLQLLGGAGHALLRLVGSPHLPLLLRSAHCLVVGPLLLIHPPFSTSFSTLPAAGFEASAAGSRASSSARRRRAVPLKLSAKAPFPLRCAVLFEIDEEKSRPSHCVSQQ
jgi:hypothetical protein